MFHSLTSSIIANILSLRGINYEYEKPLPSKKDPKDVRIPDFTITYQGRRFYWEHLSSTLREYRSLWRKKKRWYDENNYGDKLIISKETKKGGIDSKEIIRIIEERILKPEF